MNDLKLNSSIYLYILLANSIRDFSYCLRKRKQYDDENVLNHVLMVVIVEVDIVHVFVIIIVERHV
jgi:hypothetical protein